MVYAPLRRISTISSSGITLGKELTKMPCLLISPKKAPQLCPKKQHLHMVTILSRFPLRIRGRNSADGPPSAFPSHLGVPSLHERGLSRGRLHVVQSDLDQVGGDMEVPHTTMCELKKAPPQRGVRLIQSITLTSIMDDLRKLCGPRPEPVL